MEPNHTYKILHSQGKQKNKQKKKKKKEKKTYRMGENAFKWWYW